ncbi:MAG: caspase domain-containing protein [Ktedonobacteraceae bacterium]
MSVNPSILNKIDTSHEEVNKVAVIVGNNSTSSSYFAPLKYAESDAYEIADVLKQPACNFGLLYPPLVGERADSASVRRAVTKLAQRKSDQDFLLFYFSGHAMPINVGARRTDVYLVTHNFSPEEVNTDPDAHVSMSWLRKILFERTEAGRVLIILDCSYAGHIALAETNTQQIDMRELVEDAFDTPSERRTKDSSRVILAVSGATAKAMEKEGHGLLTGSMLPVLAGKVGEALDINGRVDVLSLYQYLSQKLSQQ